MTRSRSLEEDIMVRLVSGLSGQGRPRTHWLDKMDKDGEHWSNEWPTIDRDWTDNGWDISATAYDIVWECVFFSKFIQNGHIFVISKNKMIPLQNSGMKGYKHCFKVCCKLSLLSRLFNRIKKNMLNVKWKLQSIKIQTSCETELLGQKKKKKTAPERHGKATASPVKQVIAVW